MNKRNIAFVVQRYGTEINGGAELHCKQVAERLVGRGHSVDVLTTCATNYYSWKNELPKGETSINNVFVKRFEVEIPRSHRREKLFRPFLHPRKKLLKSFRLLHLAGSYLHYFRKSDRWVQAQGPFCPDLIDYLRSNEQKYDVIIFMTYLYYPTVVGLRIAPHKSILIPTAHNETSIHFSVFREVFTTPSFIMFNMESEKEFVQQKFDNKHIPCNVAGVGIEYPPIPTNFDFKKHYKISGDFLLYVGRVDKKKGALDLINHFLRYKASHNNHLKLVIIGQVFINIPEHKDLLSLGFVSDTVKNSAIKQATMMIIPSRFESLSMVLLESLSYGTPILVNGECPVLVEHCNKSRAGIYFRNYSDFKNHIDYYLNNKESLNLLSENGKKYIQENYQWEVILDKFEQAFNLIQNTNNEPEK